jgi:hypothetical protein
MKAPGAQTETNAEQRIRGKIKSIATCPVNAVLSLLQECERLDAMAQRRPGLPLPQ